MINNILHHNYFIFHFGCFLSPVYLLGRTIAEKLSDVNRPTWEQYKKDNEDKLDNIGAEMKKMVQYRQELDKEREKKLMLASGGGKEKRKKSSSAISDSDDDSSDESEEDKHKSSKKKKDKKKHKKKKHKVD